eukprot:g4349.t1
MRKKPLSAKSLGRFKLLEWLNYTVEADYSKVEQLKDGIAFLQVLDMAVPNVVPLHKARMQENMNEFDHLHNIKLLERAMKKIEKKFDMQLRLFDVNRLASGKFSDNLDQLKWSYDFLTERQASGKVEEYKGYERRRKAMEKAGRIEMKHSAEKSKSPVFKQYSPHTFFDPFGNSRNESRESTKSRQHNFESQNISPRKLEGDFSMEKFEHEQFSVPNVQEEVPSTYQRRVDELRELVKALEAELSARFFGQQTNQREILSVKEERDQLFKKLNEIELECIAHKELDRFEADSASTSFTGDAAAKQNQKEGEAKVILGILYAKE